MSCPHSDDGDACAICKQEGEDGEEFMFLTCAHKFHKYCIDEYAAFLKEHEGEDAIIVCPICKKGRILSEADDDMPTTAVLDDELAVGELWDLVLGPSSTGTLLDNDPSGSAAPSDAHPANQEDSSGLAADAHVKVENGKGKKGKGKAKGVRMQVRRRGKGEQAGKAQGKGKGNRAPAGKGGRGRGNGRRRGTRRGRGNGKERGKRRRRESR